ncbi:YkvA family protein [Nioella nitratireducens]|uniref:YkvA family protein n=1 Tax=Nioella nitratireducens TaxID=1287720 RepID=UPI0008FD8DF9|nr:YkvA family protein [Nioella nitratireducens]
MKRLKHWARRLKRDLLALWIAARDPRTPLSARMVATAVAAYALSPIDLIPDFIPILGYVDDLLLLPLGILVAIRLIPPALMAEFRQRSCEWKWPPASLAGAVAIIVIWGLLAALAAGMILARG